MAAGPGPEGRRQMWTRAASSSSSFSSGSSAISRRLPVPTSPLTAESTPEAGLDAEDAAAAAAANKDGVVVTAMVAEEKEGPAAAGLTSTLAVGSSGNLHQRKQIGRLFNSVRGSKPQEGGCSSAPLSRHSPVKAAAKVAADAHVAQGATTASCPSPLLAKMALSPALPRQEEAHAVSASLDRSTTVTAVAATPAPAATAGVFPVVADTKRPHEEGTGPDSAGATVGECEGIESTRQMWEKRASTVGSLQYRSAPGSSSHANQEPELGSSGSTQPPRAYERRLSWEAGPGSGSVASMKVGIVLYCGYDRDMMSKAVTLHLFVLCMLFMPVFVDLRNTLVPQRTRCAICLSVRTCNCSAPQQPYAGWAKSLSKSLLCPWGWLPVVLLQKRLSTCSHSPPLSPPDRVFQPCLCAQRTTVCANDL